MATFNGDWQIINSGADIETKIDPIYSTDGNNTIVAWDKRYRQITTYTRMETFFGATTFSPTVQPPYPGASRRISDNFNVTNKEIGGGEHTETYQEIGEWASF